MNNYPKVSVLMSVYNNETTIEKSIESLLRQSYKNIEILINDDCSSDNSVNLIKKLQSESSNIFFFSNDENIGLTKSLNKLIKLSSADIIARQDADDFSNHKRIEYQIKCLIENNLDFVSSRATIIGTGKKIPGISFYIPHKQLLKYKNPFIHGTLMVKKEFLEKVGFYNENYYYAQDYKLMIDLVLNKAKYKVLNKQLYSLNMKDNISSKYLKRQNEFALMAKNSYKKGIA